MAAIANVSVLANDVCEALRAPARFELLRKSRGTKFEILFEVTSEDELSLPP